GLRLSPSHSKHRLFPDQPLVSTSEPERHAGRTEGVECWSGPDGLAAPDLRRLRVRLRAAGCLCPLRLVGHRGSRLRPLRRSLQYDKSGLWLTDDQGTLANPSQVEKTARTTALSHNSPSSCLRRNADPFSKEMQPAR